MSVLRENFLSDGFVRVDQFFSVSMVREIRGEIARYISDVVPGLDRRFKLLKNEDPTLISKLDCLNLHDSYFHSLLKEERLMNFAAEILDGEVRSQFLHFQNSLPNQGGEVLAHQDAFGPNFDPPRSVNVWLSLGAYRAGDGCLRYLRQSHLGGYQPELYGPVPNSLYDSDREAVMETMAGDILTHDSFTVHRSGLNYGKGDRWALIFAYYSKNSVQLSDEEWLKKYGPKGKMIRPSIGRAYEQGVAPPP